MATWHASLLLRRRRLPGLLLMLVVPALLAGACLAAEPDAGTGPARIARRTVADLLGIAIDATRVVTVEAVDFPDSSLGCPEPGMAYLQVITPGTKVILEADGRRFDVRVAGTGPRARGRICHPRKASGGPDSGPGTGPLPRELGESARQDLAGRLGIPPEAIVVTRLRSLLPGDTLPGCGEVCPAGTEPAACGVAVRLNAQLPDTEREFDYVAQPAGVRPCPDIAPR